MNNFKDETWLREDNDHHVYNNERDERSPLRLVERFTKALTKETL